MIPTIKKLKPIQKEGVLSILEQPQTPEKLVELKEKEKVDIKDLSWSDKENVLRILFSKMNGVSLANEAEKRAKSLQDLEASKHRPGFAELETIVLDQAAAQLTQQPPAAENSELKRAQSERWVVASQ